MSKVMLLLKNTETRTFRLKIAKEETKTRKQDLYYGVIKKKTDMFSSEYADLIFDNLIEFAK